MNFKIGDRVRILPSAIYGGVSEWAIGEIGTITRYDSDVGYFCVLMDYVQKYGTWAVYPDQMEPAHKVGQQLLLWEDTYECD